MFTALNVHDRSLPSVGRAAQFERTIVIAKLLVSFIRVYQGLLSPLLGNVCRFHPSCSRYAVACLESHGAWRGSLLSFWRLCKCHPFHPGGVDLPPPPKSLPGSQSVAALEAKSG